MRSEGQRQLWETGASYLEIARAVGVSKAAVIEWKLGRKSPGRSNRAALWGAYKIPAIAWARMPANDDDDTGEPPPAPPPTNGHAASNGHGNGHAAQLTEQAASSTSSPSSLQEADQLLANIRRHASDTQLLPADRVRLADSEAKLLALRHRMQRDNDLLEDRIIREHPTWRRIKETLARVLSRYPQAANDVADALDKLGM